MDFSRNQQYNTILCNFNALIYLAYNVLYENCQLHKINKISCTHKLATVANWTGQNEDGIISRKSEQDVLTVLLLMCCCSISMCEQNNISFVSAGYLLVLPYSGCCGSVNKGVCHFFSQSTYPYGVCVHKINPQISLHFFMEKYCFMEKKSACSFNCDSSTLQAENRRMNSDGVQV